MNEKLFRFGLIGLASIFMYACASEEPNGGGVTVNSDRTYLSVAINTVDNASTRADEDAAKSSFENGTADEQTVTSARFLFYDSNGDFVTEGTIWENGDKVTNDENVEYFGKSVLILKNIDFYPSYVVTLLNAPDSVAFKAPATLAQMETALTDMAKVENGKNGGNFVMSTSSYRHGSESASLVEPYYFVTSVSADQFSPSVTDAEKAENSLEIYVERLAVKVRLKSTDAGSETTIYSLSDLKVDGVQVANSIELQGWGLDCTTKQSYYSKNINVNWIESGVAGDNNLNFPWNASSYHRSYWGKSYNYGSNDMVYPDRYETTLDGKESDFNYLQYISADKLDVALNGGYTYCFENTNIPSKLVATNGLKYSAITGVVVKAVLKYGADENSLAAKSLVRYHGDLYTEGKYIEYVFNALDKLGQLDYKNKSDVKLSASDLTIANAEKLNGRVIVQLQDASAFADAIAINQVLADFNSENEAIGYKDGLMYYFIPLQHLSQTADTTAAVESSDGKINNTNRVTAVAEGRYGAVRNHLYDVTITSISHIGQGIEVPTEPIIPNPEDDLYSISAQINILSWRIVTNSISI